MTREPTGHPEADDAQGPSRPPRPRPSRAGPVPRAGTGPMPRAGTDPWRGTTPGFEFEGRRHRRPPPRGDTGSRDPRYDDRAGEPRRFRYTPTVGPPLPAPPPEWPARQWPDNPALAAGAEFRTAPPRAAAPPRDAAPPREPGPRQRAAAAEWAALLRSLVREPVKRRWSRQFLDGLEFRGWGVRVAIPILAMVVFGVAVAVIADANSGHAGPTPPAAALGFPPATLAGNDFTAADTGRGISQALGHVASDGAEIVAVGSQAGARIARARFFVSADDGRSWTLGAVRDASGGVPPPGHGAIFVAGGRGAWVALGPGSIWTSADGRTWTLAPGNGMPLQPGDQISAVQRTAAGFIAVGANQPARDQARSTPLIFLSANGISWERLDAARLRLAGSGGRVLDLRYAAAAGSRILIAGDVLTTEVAGKPRRTVPAAAGAAWLSSDGGSTWAPATGPVLAPPGPGARPQVAGVAAAGDGFVLFRPATVANRTAVDAYYSPNGLAFTFQATLGAAAGFTAGVASGGPDGAVLTGAEGLTGQEAGPGRTLTAFVSADGRSWRQSRPLGASASQTVSGVTLAPDGAVITAGTGAATDSRQPVITLAGPAAGPDQVDIAGIPGATEDQVAVNGLAAQGSMQIAVGSANGFPAAWASADGGSSWTRAAGGTAAVFGRPGSQQLTSVTHGTRGWLAVGGVTANAAEHPVVVVSADGRTWQAADGEGAFGGPGLFTDAAAADGQGYVIVGRQNIRQAGGGTVTVGAAWYSAGLTGWQRAGDAVPGALDGPGARRMLAVAADPAGFVAVGSHGDQPSAWISADGRTWRQADLPRPAGAARAVLQHVASSGRTVAAVGTAITAAGREVPFAASSSDGGASWTESALPPPAGLASVTALAAAGGTFTATGTYGSTPGHQNVVVWTSPDGTAWRADEPAGQGLTGPGIQAITSLTVSGSTLAGVGFTASPASEQPVFWQSPIR